MHQSVRIRLAPAAVSLLVGFAFPAIAAASAPSGTTPVFKLIEGKAWSSYPYSPPVLHIPAGKTVALELTDNIGGCGLVTVFPHLGPQGKTVSIRVPVGDTKRILIHAPKPGKYVYHCSENMWYGEIVAE